MDNLNDTILQLTEKNKRIRSRLRDQGVSYDSDVIRGAGSSKKSLGNITRLSYGTWSGNQFLSSTHMSTSMADFVSEETAPRHPPGGKKKKLKKKTKLKMLSAISFSSEEEEMANADIPPLATKSTKNSKAGLTNPIPSTSRGTLKQLTDNVQPLPGIGSQGNEANRENVPNIKRTTVIPLEDQSTTKKDTRTGRSQAVTRKDTSKAQKTKAGTVKTSGSSIATTKPALTSGVERINLLWGMNPSSNPTESDGSVCPETSLSSRAHSLSISSQASQSIISKKQKTKKQIKKKEPQVKAKKGRLLDINFSSESDTEIERNREKLAEFSKKLKNKSIMQSILVSSDESRHNKTEDLACATNKSAGASSVDIKRFVMDSDSESDERKQRGVNIVIPCTQDVETGNLDSGESMEEAYVTIPCSQEEEPTRDKTYVPCTQTQDKTQKKSCDVNLVIPDSEEMDTVENNGGERNEENIVLVEATEPLSSEEELVVEGGIDTIPCSQEIDATEKNGSDQKKENIVLVQDTEPLSSEEELVDEGGIDTIPCSQEIDVTEKNGSDQKKENIVLVQDTEPLSSEEEFVDSGGIDTIPCSQYVRGETTSPKGQAKDDSVITVEDTPSLVNKLRNVLHAAMDSSDEIVPCSQMPVEKSSKKKKVKGKGKSTKQKQSASRRKNLFEAFQFSSEEDDLKENSPEPQVPLVADSAVSNDSSSLSNHNDTNISLLSQRLQNILQKSQKKKGKTDSKKTKKVPKSKKRMNFSSSSGDSVQREGRSSERSVVPDSESAHSCNAQSEDSISVIEDSQNPQILVPDSESVGMEVADVPDISVPDSQGSNLGLQMSVSASSPASLTPSAENTVRYVPPRASDKKTYGRQQREAGVRSASSDEYSPEIPVFRNPVHPIIQEEDDVSEEDDVPEKANMSVQVSMMSPSTDDDEEEESNVNKQREISIQVSMMEADSSPGNYDDNDGDDDDGQGSNSDTRNPEFFTPPENRTVNLTLGDENLSSGSSPKMMSFSTQVSLPSLPQDDTTGPTNVERLSYNGLDSSEKSIEVSMETDIVRNLGKELANDGDDSTDVDDNLVLESEDDDDNDVQAGIGRNMSLQVSMCVDAVMEDSDDEEVEGNNDPQPSQHQVSLQVSLGEDSDEEVTRPTQRNKRSQRPQILEESSDSDLEIIDDSDADPDFNVSPKKPTKGAKASSATKKPTRKPRSRGSDKSDSSNKNYTEAQSIKTVLLCERKESVKGFDPETDDDDYELPDIAPPKETSTQQQDESSDDNFDNFLEELRNRKKEKERKIQESNRSLDDFIVDDDDVTSGEDDNEGFYSRTSRELEKTRKNRTTSYGSDSVFKTPGKTPAKTPARTQWKTPQPGPSSIHVKQVSKTPAPGRVHRLASADNDLRSNSTGHLPVFHGFLKSLSSDLEDRERHPEARRFVKDFKKLKEELTSKLFKLYNETVFATELPADLKILWNSRLTTTAGYCAYKRDKSTSTGRTCRVELSVKVCDTAERVRDTLVHELCHAAVWLIYGKNDGHGRYWQTLASKAMRIHPDLPSISRCHMYDIHHKFIYKCSKCGQQIGRHTKSLNVEKKVCGICHGKFEVMLNTPKGLTPQASRTPRTPNKFALFVKDNYNSIKQKNTGFKHADVMKALSAEFAAKTKVS